MKRPTLIELGRRFAAVSKGETSWREREERSMWLPAATAGWPDLLQLPCAVVLGEAGAGKTAEFRRAAAVVSEKQGIGFFLPVEAVALAGVDRSFTPAQRDAFRDWSGGNAPGWLFLDSVDEAKLKRRSLASALNALSGELETVLSRLHLVVSSRTSDWRSADEEAVSAIQPYLAAGRTTKEDAPFMFELAPLDKAQIAQLAELHHLTGADLEAFLAAAKAADAWSFLERPLDVLALVSYWKDRRRLGAHREVVSASIDVKLAEDPDRESSLSPVRARIGAQKLALAGILSQKPAFVLPGEEQDERAADALVPAKLLPDWSDAEIKALLTRGLFDEATYGRVRIHHRQAQEYLAADELLQMVDQGWPKADLEALLFCNSSGVVVTPAHLQAVAAWCSLRSRDVKNRALQIIPEHLLDRGDPAGLLPEDRRAALLAYVERFGKQTRVFHSFDYFGLKRFACPELAATILELLEDAASPEHLRTLLLEMVEYGEVAQCAAAARTIALDLETSLISDNYSCRSTTIRFAESGAC